MKRTIHPAARLRGEIAVPGDKSISHRALLLAAIAASDSVLDELSGGRDVRSTLAAIRQLGVPAEESAAGSGEGTTEATGDVAAAATRRKAKTSVRIRGGGLEGLREPTAPIDCGNSGTTMRLLAGLLAGQPFTSTLTGDASLRTRPMERIAEPLRAMGCAVETAGNGTAPLRIHGSGSLRGITYRPSVASAQTKSCVLLAGLYADGPTRVVEPALTRDHTERLLEAMGAAIGCDVPAGSANRDGEGAPGPSGGREVSIAPRPRLHGIRGAAPGDVSSAAYWIVAASLRPGSELKLTGVGLNPSRTAIIDLLCDWGACIEVRPDLDWYGEPRGSIAVRGRGEPLRGGSIDSTKAPALIDELPLLACLAPMTTEGVEIRGAAELRVKESDRIATTAAALRALGVAIEEFPDGLAVAGRQQLGGGDVNAAGDHRIGLAVAAVAHAAAGPVTIDGAEAVDVSYPGFFDEYQRVTDD